MSLTNVDKQILIDFYKVQWKIIHDLDNLDWRVALIFIPLIGAFSAVIGILSQWVPPEITNYTKSIQAFAWVVFVLCLYGLWTVAKGQAHSMLKFETLGKIEKDLGLDSYVFTRPRDCKFHGIWRIIVCRRFLLFTVYLSFGILSFSMTAIPINEWTFSILLNRVVLAVPLVLAFIILLVQFYDYRLHLKRQDSKEISMVQKKPKFEIKDIVLSLWGVVLAFVVQVLYDIFGQEFYTNILPKVWWGIIISVFLSILLLVYIRRLKST